MAAVSGAGILFGHIVSGNTGSARDLLRRLHNVDIRDEVRFRTSLLLMQICKTNNLLRNSSLGVQRASQVPQFYTQISRGIWKGVSNICSF